MSSTTNAADTRNEYTIAADAVAVPVRAFRNAIERLECLINVDRHGAVRPSERADWVARARRAGSDLIRTTCKRANRGDWDRRERAIDASAHRIAAAVSP